jgi:trimethylamine--corrinoid protein Co-methyltransferase
LLPESDLDRLHQSALRILDETGVGIAHAQVRQTLAEAGAQVEPGGDRVHFSEALVAAALEVAGRAYTLYGRDPACAAQFGPGAGRLVSSPGQFAWFDHRTGQRRPAHMADLHAAGLLGDALPNIAVVGAMAVPEETPQAARDLIQTAELLRRTTKPVRAFPVSRQSTRCVLELFACVAGGRAELRARPMAEMLLNPISPLLMPSSELDILLEFLAWGQPVCIAPMPMASGTGPATLAGTLALAHAEFLAGLVIVQALAPGTPVMYGCIPHILDPRTALCSFGAPEQGLMALAMAGLGRSLGFPIYVNVNLSDSKCMDAQAGLEKGFSLMAGMLAGVDLFGHAGIVGADLGASLAWLVLDDQAVSFAHRFRRGFEIDDERLALGTIASVGPGGSYLAEQHTRDHFRREIWLADDLWTRQPYDQWLETGGSDIFQRAASRVDHILNTHIPTPLDPDLDREFERIVASCLKELL